MPHHLKIRASNNKKITTDVKQLIGVELFVVDYVTKFLGDTNRVVPSGELRGIP